MALSGVRSVGLSRGKPQRLGDSYAFDAFISYSHRHDGVFAACLQVALERFAKPWYRMRAIRVFRDTADLAADPQLWRSIEKALAASAWLVLLASDESAASKWVNREVAWWLKHRSSDRLLIAATSPGLDWDEARKGWAPGSPVPRSLRRALAHEPLWIDLTGVHDAAGWREIPHDILAGVAAPVRGTTKDKLTNEHQRQHRRTLRQAGYAVVLLATLSIGLVATTVFALNSRQQAIRQQAIAVRSAHRADQQHAVALSRQLAAESVSAASLDQPFIARQLAVAAWTVSPTSQAAGAMASLVADQQQNSLLPAAPISDTGSVTAIAFSPDRRLLATGDDDGTLRLWNAVTGAPVRTIRVGNSDDAVRALAFSPDSELLATGDDNGDLQVRDAGSGRLLVTLRSPALSFIGNVTGMAFRPGARLLAVSYTDGQVRLFSTANWKIVHVIDADYKPDEGGGGLGVNGVDFSPDGKLLATADSNDKTRLWNAATGRPVLTLKSTIPAVDGVGGAAFSPGGKLLATADGNGAIQLWNLATRHVTSLGHSDASTGNAVYRVAFSPDGRLLAAADLSGQIRMWNLATGKLLLDRPADSNAAPGEVAFSPDGRLLAGTDGDGTVEVWNTATALPATQSLPDVSAAGGIDDIAFSPAGHLMAGAGANGTIPLWNYVTGRLTRILPASAAGTAIASVTFSPHGNVLVSLDSDHKPTGLPADGIVRLWKPATGQLIHSVPGPVAAAAFSPDGNMLATGGGGGNDSVRLWNVATGHLIRTLQPPNPRSVGIANLAFAPNGRYLAVGDDGDDEIRIWNIATGDIVHAWNASDSGNGIAAIAFTPNSDIFASNGGENDNSIRLWNTATGKLTRTLRLTSSDGVDDIEFSPDGETIASADADGNIQLWNVLNGREIGAPLGGAAPATAENVTISIAFSPDGKILAGTAADGTIQLWNPRTGRPISGSFGPAAAQGSTSIMFSPDGTLLAELPATATMKTWTIAAFADPYATLCADVGPPSPATWATYAAGEKEPRICSAADRL